MTSFNFLNRQPKVQCYSLLDVGCDSIKVGLLKRPADGTLPQLVGYGHASAERHDLTGGRAEAEAIAEIANRLLTETEDRSIDAAGRKLVPDELICAVPSRATFGQMFIVDLKRPKSHEPISEKEMAQLTKRAESLAWQDLSKLTAEEGHWQPFSLTQTGMQVDGSSVSKGVGLMGRNVSFSLFGLAVEPRVMRALETLANQLNLSLLSCVASSQALAALLPRQQAMVLEIGFSGTGIYLVRNGLLHAANWVAFGGNFFSQALAQSASLKLDTANQLKHDFTNGVLSSHERNWVNKHLEAPRQRWHEAVSAELTELAQAHGIPRRIYLTGGGSQLTELDKRLRIETAPFDGAPEILRLKSMLPAAFNQSDGCLFAVLAGISFYNFQSV